MDKAQSFAMQYGYYDKEKKRACCVGFNAGYKHAEKDTIERAVKWLERHADEYNGSESAYDHMEEDMVADFRKAMEE